MFQEVTAPVVEGPSPAEALVPAEDFADIPPPAPTPAGGVSLGISQGGYYMISVK